MNLNTRCICQICICGNHRCVGSNHEKQQVMPTDYRTSSQQIFQGNGHQNVSAAVDAKAGAGVQVSNQEQFKSRSSWEKERLENVHKSLVNLMLENPINEVMKDNNLDQLGRKNSSSCSQRSLPPLHGSSGSDNQDMANGHQQQVMEKAELRGDRKVARKVAVTPPFAVHDQQHQQPVIKERRRSGHENYSHGAAGEREHSNTKVMRERGGSDGNHVEVEWIVMKPERKKPSDLLKLEGNLDMETTFQSSIEKTAQEILGEFRRGVNKIVTENGQQQFDRGGNKTSAGHGQGNQGQKLEKMEEQLTSKPAGIRKRSLLRPKTSLKLEGPGYYSTVNRDSFKKFVVVDVNNNDGNRQGTSVAVDTTIVTSSVSPTKADGSGGGRRHYNHPKDQIGTTEQDLQVFKSELNQGNSDGQMVSLPKLEKVVKKSSKRGEQKRRKRSAKDGPKDVQILTLHDNERQAKHEMAQHESFEDRGHQMGRRVVTDYGQQEILDNPDATDIHYRVNQDSERYPKHKLGEYQVSDQELVERHQELGHNKRDHVDRGRKHFDTEDHINNYSRSRHHSLPRNVSKCHHKNESHLKFEGEMDFETTSRNMSNMIVNCSHTDGKHNYGVSRGHRDLFKSTNDLFVDPKSKFDSSTTYQCQFRDKHYCPAIDLGSKKSDYVYKKQAHGHSFYCRAN